MSKETSMMLLVGDNPFHGISHLSQDRSRARGDVMSNVDYAAALVKTAMDNGAEGFMFSVSETTLSILQRVSRDGQDNLTLYAIVPYAYEYVRLAAQMGGVTGLARKVAKQILVSMNVKAMAMGLKAIAFTDLAAFLKTYILYEVSRIKSVAGKNANLNSVMLHEIITEMALALNLDWLIKSYIEFMLKLRMKPGFETRNFAYLVDKFRDWDIDFRDIAIATAFNKVGFQMNPSKLECEAALEEVAGSHVIAMSILAAGYLKPLEAIDYILTLPNLKGIVVGVSKERHAYETFQLLRKKLQ